MGGLIARYALADMEQTPNQNHDTRLYISHDAPHQGANIPISIQYLARHLTDQFVSTPVGDMDLPAAGGGSVTISDIQNVFNSIGTRQLLANTINGSFRLDNSAFNSFQAELQVKGYPQQTRNIAISNGSHCANNQEVQALQELFYLGGSIEPTILLDTIINYIPFLSFVEGLGYAGLAIILKDPAYLAGLLPGRTNLNARFQAKTLPNVGQTANIYSGRIRITKKINFILFKLTYNINITNRNYNNPNEIQLPLDSYPGGAYNMFFDLSSINSNTNNLLINLNLTGRSADSFNFIPTTSALDIGRGNTRLNDNDYRSVYTAVTPPTGNKSIPFHNFTTSYNTGGTNEAHISFNRRNGDWLATELDDIPNNQDVFDCSFVCSTSPITGISGNQVLCNGGTSTYTLPQGAENYSWQITSGGNLVTINNSNNNSVSLTSTSNSNVSGNVILEGTISSTRCNNFTQTIRKQIWVGKPSITTELDPNYNLIRINLVGTPNTNIQNQGITATTWEKISNYGCNVSFNGSNFRGMAYGSCLNFNIRVKITATNACGSTTIYKGISPPTPLPCDDRYSGNYSRPGEGVRGIIFPDCNNRRGNRGINSQPENTIISVNDYYGQKLYSKTQKEANFDTSKLKKGFYIIKYQTKSGYTYSKKLIVKQ